MFSVEEKRRIAAEIEKLLLSLNHPEMPKDKPFFHLRVDGAASWSFANIVPNWTIDGCLPEPNPWNEIARDVMDGKRD